MIRKKFKVGNYYYYEIIRFLEDFPYTKEKEFIEKHNLSIKKTVNDNNDVNSFFGYNSVDVAIMFSGGFDSLSLAIRHLEKGESVALLSICFNPDEQIAAILSYRILEEIYGKDKVSFVKLFGELTFNNLESTIGLSQQPISAFYATFMPDTIRRSAKSLEIAYCMNDDAISFLPELKNIYYNAFNCKIFNESDYPKISFPLIKTKHYENIDYVVNFEKAHNVLFPTFSSEFCNTFQYKKGTTEIISIVCDKNVEKENKACKVAGYIVKISLL